MTPVGVQVDGNYDLAVVGSGGAALLATLAPILS